MSFTQINSKTIARIAAIQAIYQYQYAEQDIGLIITQIAEYYKEHNTCYIDHNPNKPIKIKLSLRHFELLVKAVIEKLFSIDKKISEYLEKSNSIEKLPILLLALLRVAVCELCYFPGTPNKVVINEYTDISSEMLNGNEVSFINSILDNISKLKNAEIVNEE